MDYRLSETGGVVTVALAGSLNFAVNENFQSLLAKAVAAKPRRVVFDLSGLKAIDSVGLGLLYIAQEDLSAIGAKLALASPREAVARLLELTEADKTFEIIA